MRRTTANLVRATTAATLLLLGLLFWASSGSGAYRPPSPFGVTATLTDSATQSVVRVQFTVPPDHVLYAERLRFETGDGTVLTPLQIPAPVLAHDKVTGRERIMYNRSFAADIARNPPLLTNLVVKMQGCSNSECYFPEKRFFRVTAESVVAEVAPREPSVNVTSATNAPADDWKAKSEKFNVVARASGFIAPGDFVSFLNKAKLGVLADDPLARYTRFGLGATLFFILVGGMALNLTPCVLPLIPVNLAIIGAGTQARSRRQGFRHGAIYGAGMALVYGVLGLVVVLTGSTFGTLNSSVWFNAIIALVFVALALAMFDLVNLGITRVQSTLGETEFFTRKRPQHSLSAFLLGGMAALLAGACVAPVVVSVLLLSAQLYAQGTVLGLLLPFVLGLGMALPWPFAGASLTFLPKPGRWMKWVKHSFGVLILLFAFYYGHLAYKLSRTERLAATPVSARADGAVAVPAANESLVQALEQARLQGRPVLIDFQASWCKSCVAMEETVFTTTNVQQQLQEFIVVKYQAEQPNESPAKEVLDRFGVMGLPTYVVLVPTPDAKPIN